jgi:hypothetical protein
MLVIRLRTLQPSFASICWLAECSCEDARRRWSCIGTSPSRRGWVGNTRSAVHSTAGKQRLGGIGRARNERLRVSLVTGVTSVMKAAMKPGSKQMTDWLRARLPRKPHKLVAVALANKMARVAWALMARGVYRPSTAFAGGAVAPTGRPHLHQRPGSRNRNRGRCRGKGIGLLDDARRADPDRYHCIAHPPSTTSDCPVMKPASSDTRKATAPATSLGSPRRFRLWSALSSAFTASGAP